MQYSPFFVNNRFRHTPCQHQSACYNIIYIMINNTQKHVNSRTSTKPRIIKKTIFIAILYAVLFVNFPVYAEDGAQLEDGAQSEDNLQSEDTVQPEGSIQYFEEKLTISATINFHNGLFYHEKTSLSTNRILNVGLGFRYKNISALVSFPIPFKISLLDIDINQYFDKIYFNAYFKYYKEFYSNNTSEKSGLDILSSAITATYVVNHKNHSLSSVIDLDKKQTVSNGSLLYSFGTFFSSIYSTDEAMNDYNKKRQNLLYFGPGIGCSYTRVFGNDMFFNASLVIYTNMGINVNTKKISFIPQFVPQIIVGQHRKTWSFNIKLANNSEFIIKGQNVFDIITLSSISTIVSKRF